MSAPFHFRKIPTQVRGKLLYLPMYTRALALLLKQSCDDHGRIELDGKHPSDAVARLCAASPNERRRIATDIDELVRVGYLRWDNDVLVVVEQEQDWELIDSTRMGRASSARGQRIANSSPTHQQNDATTTPQNHRSSLSARNYSTGFDRREETRREEEEKRKDHTREQGGMGGQAPKTDPTPTLRKQELAKAVSQRANNGQPETTAQANDPTDDEVAKTREPNSRTETALRGPSEVTPHVQVVEPSKTRLNADQGQRRKGAKSRGVDPTTAAAPIVVQLSHAEHAVIQAIKADQDLVRMCRNVEQLAVDLVRCAPLVDVALEVQKAGRWLRSDRGAAAKRKDGNRFLANWMDRQQSEQAERQANAVQYAAPPVEPRQPAPPPPPPHPLVLEGAAEARRRREAGETFDLRKAFKVGHQFVNNEPTQVKL
jgi:hypothetical protein